MRTSHYSVGINAVVVATLTSEGACQFIRHSLALAGGDERKAFNIRDSYNYNTALHTVYAHVWQLGTMFGDVTPQQIESYFEEGTFAVGYDKNAIHLR